MKKKKRTKNKRIVFGKQSLIVFSKFVTHPITGFTLEEIDERINFDFLDELAPPVNPRGRKPLPFKAKCKMLFALFCERLPSLSELSRKLEQNKRLREFCGFTKGKTPKKQTISDFIIGLPIVIQENIFAEFHKQLQRVEYVENNTVSIDSCVYKTVNKRKDMPKIEKRNNETGHLKKVYGIKQVNAVLAQRGVCSGFTTDFVGHHDSIYYESVLDKTLDNGYQCQYSAADKAFDSNELRWITLLKYGIQAVIPKRAFDKKDSNKSYRKRRRSLKNFPTIQEQKVYNDRTAVERYYYKLEIPLGLSKLKTKRAESGATILAFANMFDVICRTTHLHETLENAIVPLT